MDDINASAAPHSGHGRMGRARGAVRSISSACGSQARHNSSVTGKPIAIFGACWHLGRRGLLTPAEGDALASVEDCFRENLPEPPFYQDANARRAITWIKRPAAERLLDRLEPLLLDRHGVPFDIVLSNHPGEIVYEDAYQVPAVEQET